MVCSCHCGNFKELLHYNSFFIQSNNICCRFLLSHRSLLWPFLSGYLFKRLLLSSFRKFLNSYTYYLPIGMSPNLKLFAEMQNSVKCVVKSIA